MLRTSPIDDTPRPSNRLEAIRFLLDMGDKTHSDFNVSDRNVRFLLAEIDRLTAERGKLVEASVAAGWFFLRQQRPDSIAGLISLIRRVDPGDIGDDVIAELAEHDRKYRETKPCS